MNNNLYFYKYFLVRSVSWFHLSCIFNALMLIIDKDFKLMYKNTNDCIWGEWSVWNDFSLTSKGADQGRSRVCYNTIPQYEDDDCTADELTYSEFQRCNENPCPSKSNIKAT